MTPYAVTVTVSGMSVTFLVFAPSRGPLYSIRLRAGAVALAPIE
jgi:hypothetical protein